jgi:hypothetical protein
MHKVARHRCPACTGADSVRGVTALASHAPVVWLACCTVLLLVASGILARAALVLDPCLLFACASSKARSTVKRASTLSSCNSSAYRDFRSPLPMLAAASDHRECGCRCRFVASPSELAQTGRADVRLDGGLPESDLHRNRHRDGVDGATPNPPRPAHSLYTCNLLLRQGSLLFRRPNFGPKTPVVPQNLGRDGKNRY